MAAVSIRPPRGPHPDSNPAGFHRQPEHGFTPVCSSSSAP